MAKSYQASARSKNKPCHARLGWWHRMSWFHRLGILAGVVLLVSGLLLPEATTTHAPPTREQSRTAISSGPDSGVAEQDPQGKWHYYHLQSGQTLAQLFLDNQLPAQDIFAMANVQGKNQPLSNLSTGQLVKIRINKQGKVTGLTLDTAEGSVLFTRQPDDNFIRVQ